MNSIKARFLIVITVLIAIYLSSVPLAMAEHVNVGVKVSAPKNATVGEKISYTIETYNSRDRNAKYVLTHYSAVGGSKSDYGLFQCVDLPKGQSCNRTREYLCDKVGTVTISASVSVAEDGYFDQETDFSNNHDSVSVDVKAGTPLGPLAIGLVLIVGGFIYSKIV